MDDNNKISKFSKILIVIGLVYLMFLITFSFFKKPNPFVIDLYIYSSIVLLIVLIVADSFSKITVFKVISLSKSIKEKEIEVTKEKERNERLLNHVFELTTKITNTNNQNSSVHSGFSSEDVKSLLIEVVKVVRPDNKTSELEEEEEQTIKSPINKEPDNRKTTGIQTVDKVDLFNDYRVRRRFIETTFEAEVIKFASKFNVLEGEIESDVAFSSDFKNLDPLAEFDISYDYYFKTLKKEYFIESYTSIGINPTFIYKLYLLLSKMVQYGKAKGIEVELSLFYFNFIFVENNFHKRNFERLHETFKPAIEKKILNITLIDINREMFDSFSKENL